MTADVRDSDEQRQRYGSLTSRDVAALDRAAGDAGVSVVQLMEVAGWQVARCAWHLLGEQSGDVLVVAARHLATWGCTVAAHVLAEPGSLNELLSAHMRSAEACGVRIVQSLDTAATLAASGAQLLLDGILGTGISAAPRAPQASAIRAINSHGIRVLAIDVPSGLDATSGEPYDPCVGAAVTCTLTAMKAGLWSPQAAASAGDLVVADIGMPVAAWVACGISQPTAIRGGVLLPVSSSTRD